MTSGGVPCGTPTPVKAPLRSWKSLGEREDIGQCVEALEAEGGERAKLSFGVHAHMLRHACRYAMANAGHDTRLIQDWLGHRAIQHTARYTELNPTRFKDVWR